MVYKKILKRAAKKVGRVLKRRYFKGKGYMNPKIGQMVQDVKFLKSIVNAEKKRYTTSTTTPLLVGQVNGNVTGHQVFDMTPLPGQGTGYNNRTGNSIKWVSTHFTFQFTHQTAADQAIAIDIYMVKTVGRVYTTSSNFVAEFMNPNPFVNAGVSVWDTNASRQPETFKNFIVLRKKRVYLPADNISGQAVVKTVNVGLKLKNHHVRWSTDNTSVTDGQIWCFFVASCGNISAVASTLNSAVPVKTAFSGASFNYVQTNYYYDN